MATEKAMATHSSVLAWRIPGTEEPGGLPSIRLRRVDTTEVTWQQQEGPAYPRAIFSAVSRPATPPHPSASAVPAPSPLGASLMPLMANCSSCHRDHEVWVELCPSKFIC